MDDHVNFSDAEVALRSFVRRYRKVLSGPPGDDAWERLVRKPGAAGPSALELGAGAAASLQGLAGLLESLPRTATLTVTTPPAPTVSATTAVDAVIDSVAEGATAAADAVKARRGDDEDRAVTVDGHRTTVGAHVNGVVQATARCLRDIEAATDPNC